MDTTVDPAYLEKRIFVNLLDEVREVIGDWELDGELYYRLKPTPSSSGGALSDAENERLIVSDRKQATAQKQKKAARKVRPTTKAFKNKMDALLDL